ncbi:hypothetical protein [Novacetimonas hansenii]|nr:hypothetical protein [Novacetimonas hansenii]
MAIRELASNQAARTQTPGPAPEMQEARNTPEMAVFYYFYWEIRGAAGQD